MGSRTLIAVCVVLALVAGVGMGAMLERHLTLTERLRMMDRARRRTAADLERRRTDPAGWRRDSAASAAAPALLRDRLPREVARQQLPGACVVALEVRQALEPGLLRVTPHAMDGARGPAGLTPLVIRQDSGTVVVVAVPEVECARVTQFTVGWSSVPTLPVGSFRFVPPVPVPPRAPAEPVAVRP